MAATCRYNGWTSELDKREVIVSMSEMNDFQRLLQAAAMQTEPQRLLFVFVRTELPDDHEPRQAQRFHAGLGGALLPIMYVDKAPGELTTFEDLVAESRQMGENWQLVVAGALAGRGGRPPSTEQTDSAARGMIETIRAGGDLSRFLAFDRHGDPLRFVSPSQHP